MEIYTPTLFKVGVFLYGDMMDKFNEIIIEYNKLINSRCEFLLEDGTVINLIFEKQNLPHLLGFQYLNDAHAIFRALNNKNNRTIIAENVMSKIIEENILYENLIEMNKIDYSIKRRIDEFSYKNIIGLLRGVTTFKFIYDSERLISNKAKFVFIEHRDELFIQLYIGYDKFNKFYFPLSFQPSNIKEVSLERKPHYITKTTIFHERENDTEIEVLNHLVMRPVIKELSEYIKKYKKYNDILYKKNIYGEDMSILLGEINDYFRKIENKYNELSTMINLSEFLMRRSNKKIKLFLDSYPDRFKKH